LFARQSLRLLDDLRARHGRLDQPLPVNDAGGTVRIELNHSDASVLPAGYRQGGNDVRILTVAGNLAVLPLTGVTFPFVSFGMTSLLVNTAFLALCLNVDLPPRRPGD